eukprot:gene17746-24106_t
MVALLSQRDADAVTAALPRLMQEGEIMRLRDVEPRPVQRQAVLATILELVAARRRTIYGGFALNSAVASVSPTDAIYGKDAIPDVGFYSPDPLGDVVEICRRLHAEGHDYVQGKEAVHHNTFTISVEFVRMCDITFVPPRVFAAIPTRLDPATGIQVVEPSFAMIDHLRMLCDPFTSHWRLDRMFPRLYLLQRLFPLAAGIAIAVAKEPTAAAQPVRAWLAARQTCVAVGMAALQHFSPRTAGGDGHIAVVSVEYDTDHVALWANLALSFPEAAVEFTVFNPLLDLLGRHTVITVDGTAVATVFDSAHRAVPMGGRASDGMRIAGVSYAVAMALSCAFLARVNGEPGRADAYQWMASEMCAARTAHLEDGGQTVMDQGMFRDFGMEFVGATLSPLRVHMLMTDQRLAQHGRRESAWLKFDPKNGPSTAHRTFPEVDGSPVGGKKPKLRRRRGGSRYTDVHWTRALATLEHLEVAHQKARRRRGATEIGLEVERTNKEAEGQKDRALRYPEIPVRGL